MRIIATLVLVAFLAVGVFGMSHAMGMEKKPDGTMSGCLFNGLNKICLMSFSEHLTQWQGIFTSIPSTASALALLISGLLLFAFISVFKNHFLWPQKPLSVIQKLYWLHHPNLLLFDPLREALAQGILNPKTF